MEFVVANKIFKMVKMITNILLFTGYSIYYFTFNLFIQFTLSFL